MSDKLVRLVGEYLAHYPAAVFPEFSREKLAKTSDRERRLITRASGVSRRLLCKSLLSEMQKENE